MNQNFVEYVKSHIKEYLPMEYQNAVVSINEVTKSNDRLLTGLTILSPGERSAPTIYLEALAEQVEQGLSLDAAMKQIAQIQVENHNRVPLDISVLENYEAIRPMLAVQMTYNDIVRMTGANCVSVPLSIENNFVVTRELLEQYVTGKTKMLILCNPSNPTGHVMSKEEVEAVADFALAHDILVVSDEIYERLIFDGRRHYSIGAIERVKDRVITLNGLSKSHAMMGFRFGYSAAPAELTRAMMKMQESTVTTASSISQYAAITAYDCNDYVEYMRGEYQKRRDYLYEGLNAIPCITCPKPEGTFYMFFKADYKGMNAFELADYMLKEAHILAVPGEVYGAGGEQCIRFSFAASMEDIQEAVRRLQRIFAQ